MCKEKFSSRSLLSYLLVSCSLVLLALPFAPSFVPSSLSASSCSYPHHVTLVDTAFSIGCSFLCSGPACPLVFSMWLNVVSNIFIEGLRKLGWIRENKGHHT